MPDVTVNLMGGLGNQMFQIACAYSYAKTHNGNLILRRKKNIPDGRKMYWDSVLFRFNKYLVDGIPNSLSYWKEYSATVYSTIPPLPKNGVLLYGYLQSPKYFSVHKDEIKRLMKPSNSVKKYISERYSDLLKRKDRIVVIHARRTDYLDSPERIQYHGPLTDEYYINAIDLIQKHVQDPFFVLCSDDPTFWNHLFDLVPILRNSIVLNDETDENTLALFQEFKYFIMANSSFSWWGVYLANPTHVICPKKWFGPSYKNPYNDIYEESWERI